MEDRKVKIYYFTHSNMSDLTNGSSNNDNKFIMSLPSEFNVIKVFPKRRKDNTIGLFNNLNVFLKILLLATKLKQIFVIRGTRPGYLPIILKKIMKHIIILNMGCTPFITLERIAFYKNKSYKIKHKIISRIKLKLEFQLEKLIVRDADIIFVENKQAKKIVELLGGDSSKIVTIPYYVQDYFLTTKELNYNINDGVPLIVGYTGRFHKYDDLEPLIDAIKILKEKKFPILLKLIGDGPTRSYIQKKVEKLNLGKIINFLGVQPHEMVSKIIDTEHILILPMVNNICPSTIPIKMLEGVIKGKVILTNKAGNIKSLFNPFTELVLDDLSDPNLIAQKIIEIAQNYSKYYKKAQILREKHLKTHNEECFRTQVVNNMNLIKK